MALTISRRSMMRGRPTPGEGISGWMMAHCASVMSEGEGLRIVVYSVVDGRCGLRWEIPSYDGGLLPDSLLHVGLGHVGRERDAVLAAVFQGDLIDPVVRRVRRRRLV